MFHNYQSLAFGLLTLTELATSFPTIGHTPQKWSWNNTKYMITFGDSYTYVQGLPYGLQNYSFIGDLLHPSYTPQQLLESKIIQNQTSTAEGGPNWVEYLTGCGLKPGLTSPLTCKKQLWDFAFAGSDVSEEYTPLHHNFTVPLVNATANFLTYANPTLRTFIQPTQTLIGIWIGINDISDTSTLTNVSFPALYDSIIGTLFDSVRTLHDAGYNNYLFMNLPPLNRTPGNVLKAAPLPNATMVEEWDGILATHVATFAEEVGSKGEVMLFDVNSLLNGVLDHPADYGIVNSTGYCAAYNQPLIETDPGLYGCLPLQEYFWFNTGHLTSHVHKILAGAVESFLEAQ